MPRETQFSIFLINKPGVMASVTGALAEAGVNIKALSLVDSGEHGVLRIVCADADTARKVLTDTHDRWTETEVLSVVLPGEPGTFARIAKHLGDERINVSYAYCTGSPEGGKVTAIFKVADTEKAKDILGA